jgi:oxalate decarboxylase/phosphoglucose isomerase-like protein (cupin superfamily)
MANIDPIEKLETYDLAGGSHADERGWVLFPWENLDIPIDPATIHIVQIKTGAVRGNHFHPRVSEFLCALEGDGLLKWRSEGSEIAYELEFGARRVCVRIPPGVRHAVTNTGNSDLIILAAREMDDKGDLTEAEAP